MSFSSLIRSIALPTVFVIVIASGFAPAQEAVIYSFGQNGGVDGTSPNGFVTFDPSGNLYGETLTGGPSGVLTFCDSVNGCGTVYELTPSESGWTETVIYSFCPNGQNSGNNSCPDGRSPVGGLIADKAGNLYGATQFGGNSSDPGVVFELSPPVGGGSWTETVLWTFSIHTADGFEPGANLTWDAVGNLYGTTAGGGTYNRGTVFQLSPKRGGGGWTETVLHSFGSPTEDGDPGGVVFDKAGNIYGTTLYGGSLGFGALYKLTPNGDGTWRETVLYNFDGKHAARPRGGLTFDAAGNLYGTFNQGGRLGNCDTADGTCGGVFQLSSKGHRVFLFNGTDGGGPETAVTVDSNTHTVFGTTNLGSVRAGNVFEIHGGKETVLHTFCSQNNCTDGESPAGPVVEQGGQLYGVTSEGGVGAFPGNGVVYQITP